MRGPNGPEIAAAKNSRAPHLLPCPYKRDESSFCRSFGPLVVVDTSYRKSAFCVKDLSEVLGISA